MTRKRTPQTREQQWNFNPERAQLVLDAAVRVARQDGYQWITRESVAAQAGVSVGTVSNAYQTMLELKRAVIRWAIERGDLVLLAQALVDKSPLVQGLDPDLKRKALASMAI